MTVNIDKKWPPEVIEALRRELLEDGKTVQQIADREGISRQRVYQLVGHLNRKRPPGWQPPRTGQAEKNQARVRTLFKLGLSDEEIAQKLNLSVHYIKVLRVQAGIRRTLRHTAEHDIWCALRWHELFGYTPAATDWNPQSAIAMGHRERAERYEKFRRDFGCPTTGSIQKRHGSWSKFIAKTGLKPAPIGCAAFGIFSEAPKRLSSWRSTTPDGGWSKETILQKEAEWEEYYGSEPKPSDWGASDFGKGIKAEIRRNRYRENGPPTYCTVREHFGSFGAMLEEARKRKSA